MIEILMVYLWEKFEKNICQNLCITFLKIPWQKIDFCSMFRKLNTSTEHGWFEILHGAQRKLFPKCNFFSQESTKKLTFFCQKFRDLHFLSHSIWLDFASVFHLLFVYSRKKMTKKWTKNLKILLTYLSYFFGACNP